MKQKFKGWAEVAELLRKIVNDRAVMINDGQASSLHAAADRLPNNGIIIADEVGMGKTRIAAIVAKAVIAAGGRVAILVPPGLGYQWGEELRKVDIESPQILRSLWQYLQAWEYKENNDGGNEKRIAPWFEKSLVLFSHSFTNWRLGEGSSTWRWALLPEMYARWRKCAHGRWPRDYLGNELLNDECIQQAAESIVSAISSSTKRHSVRALIEAMVEQIPWPAALSAEEYSRNAQLRPLLEQAVGLGLGVFDLVIIDEAHKSRGEGSCLNRLITQVILQSSQVRCLAMTATPVELDANQWAQMLDRIQIVDENSKSMANESIVNFADAVAKVRHSLSDANVREKYKEAAKRFKESLNPYVLRRDKREDESVIKFKERSGESYHSYRREHEILIDTANLSDEWKQAVSAAEALSFVSRQTDNTAAKRLRLTLGNGHGVAALIDQVHLDENYDKEQILLDNEAVPLESNGIELGETAKKRIEREAWWKHVLIKPFSKDGSALFSHPAILAAAEEIERICDESEKVLVFGKLTRPLQALVKLLNAREMLKCIDTNRSWPQSKVAENDWPAIVVAHQQLKRQGELDQTMLDSILAKQYRVLENQRRNIRDKLLHLIEAGFNIIGQEKGIQARGLFKVFKKSMEFGSGIDQNDQHHSVAVVSRAIHELIGDDVENASPIDFAMAFIDLVEAVSDREKDDDDKKHKESELWCVLLERLNDEFDHREGRFARLMYGDTKPETRRLLQLAFNRKHGHPKVLVAQSLVGREGLNLHKACRTVVLLHPEWNPGVVEQQIGRVDRIDSLWSEKLNEAINDGASPDRLPRIEIRPVVFKGTYDEKNWEVLQDRWNDLRAQLHGVVISPRIAKNYPHLHELIDEINNAAPNFSPSD